VDIFPMKPTVSQCETNHLKGLSRGYSYQCLCQPSPSSSPALTKPNQAYHISTCLECPVRISGTPLLSAAAVPPRVIIKRKRVHSKQESYRIPCKEGPVSPALGLLAGPFRRAQDVVQEGMRRRLTVPDICRRSMHPSPRYNDTGAPIHHLQSVLALMEVKGYENHVWSVQARSRVSSTFCVVV
jgi:hypothetical protein